jgi:uncharacterized RDD family membrane protein YckC
VNAARFDAPHLDRQARLEGTPLASFQARAAAFVIDGGIVAVLLLLPGIVGWLAGPDRSSATFTADFGAVGGFVLAVAYFALATFAGNGSTPGKRLLGIRVVSLVHDRITLWHCVERALGYAASFLEAGFGFLQYFTHPNRQTVHDRIAETIVVRAR